ncbi:MAG TPA: histidine phosphatase family protein [Rhizomicrobium sp.]|jgi:probable phosphoglycerate mutase
MTNLKHLTLYVVRHGQTEDNVTQTITAQADSPLTALGREQAKAKGVVLRKVATDLATIAFVASPLHRACVTMELLRGAADLTPAPYATDPRLMEMDFGRWTKLPEGDDRFGRDLPTAHERWNLQPPEGESQAMVFARAGQFLETVTQDSVIVCHARVVTMIRSHLLGLSPEETMRYEPPNAGFLRFAGGAETTFGE